MPNDFYNVLEKIRSLVPHIKKYVVTVMFFNIIPIVKVFHMKF